MEMNEELRRTTNSRPMAPNITRQHAAELGRNRAQDGVERQQVPFGTDLRPASPAGSAGIVS
jgi:hypothetical protein